MDDYKSLINGPPTHLEFFDKKGNLVLIERIRKKKELKRASVAQLAGGNGLRSHAV